jgi:hypothetical protein
MEQLALAPAAQDLCAFIGASPPSQCSAPQRFGTYARWPVAAFPHEGLEAPYRLKRARPQQVLQHVGRNAAESLTSRQTPGLPQAGRAPAQRPPSARASRTCVGHARLLPLPPGRACRARPGRLTNKPPKSTVERSN